MSQQIVTPFEVKTETNTGVDYSKLVHEFGLEQVTPDLLEEYIRVTKHQPHPLLTRGIFFAHRGMHSLLEDYKNGKKIYIYTGRGPSGGMHIGHMIPFMLAEHFQKVFNATVVIQLTDDEKYHFSKDNECTLDSIQQLCKENEQDIMAMGFDPKKTFIFANTKYMGQLYPNVVLLEKLVSVHKLKTVYGFEDTDSVGKFAHPCKQIAPCIPTSFPHLFPGDPNDYRCLIPCAVDQDPYFRQARDLVARLGFSKPVLIESTFLPGLQGMQTKMSSSDPSSAIYLTDSASMIKKKINKFAFSGGKDTAELHRQLGTDLTVDVCYHYAKIFEPDDEVFEEVAGDYSSGRMLTGEYKQYVYEILQVILEDHQKQKITHFGE